MGAVLEDVENGHRQVGESVHENGLELTLGIVADDHGGADLLVEGEGCVFTVDLFPESKEETCDQDGSKVLHKEDSSPADLHTEILKKYGHKSFVVRLKVTVNVRAERFSPIRQDDSALGRSALRDESDRVVVHFVNSAELVFKILHGHSSFEVGFFKERVALLVNDPNIKCTHI